MEEEFRRAFGESAEEIVELSEKDKETSEKKQHGRDPGQRRRRQATGRWRTAIWTMRLSGVGARVA